MDGATTRQEGKLSNIG